MEGAGKVADWTGLFHSTVHILNYLYYAEPCVLVGYPLCLKKIEFLKYTFYANQVNYKADIHIFR